MSRVTRLGAALLAVSTTACATADARRAATATPSPQPVEEWNLVPADELPRIWQRAASTGGVLSIEPETHVSGTQAAWKKTWEAADKFLKLYWGDEPIWFPSDLVRRTACAPSVRWSYFWNIGSGKERDLHPWFASGFDPLVGTELARAVAGSGSVDVSSCTEVQGTETPCLYGEVTPPPSFDRWFCGGSEAACKNRLAAHRDDVNEAFKGGAALCVAGPWVHERVHGGRPEIHPADVVWSRRSAGPDWRFALIPDNSGRFHEGDLFRAIPRGATGPPAFGWSRNRAVDLWIAFEHDARRPTEFDAASRCIRADGTTTPVTTIALPATGGPFTPVASPMAGSTMAVRTWATGDAVRGLFVLRAETRTRDCDAVVVALAGRATTDPVARFPLDPVGPSAPTRVAGLPLEREEPALRLRTVDALSPRRPSLRGLEEFGLVTSAGFAGGTPTEEDDQGVADGLNAALRRNAAERRRVFGTERPFRIEWEITARRRDTNAVVQVRVGVQPQPGDQHVTVRTFRSELTSEIKVNPGEAQVGVTARTKGGVKRAGDLLVSVPHGVVVRGRGVVEFTGSTPPELAGKTSGIGFSSPTSSDEWELLGEVLGWISEADAPRRLAKLQELACHPQPGPCTLTDQAARARAALRDPATRFQALRELEDPQRTFARYVRYLAIGYLYGGAADSREAQSLKDLLEAACRKPAAGAASPASFCD